MTVVWAIGAPARLPSAAAAAEPQAPAATIAAKQVGSKSPPKSGPESGPEIEAKVEAWLAQLTLDEELSLLGGVDGFYIPAIPRLGIPRVKMADGPMGVRNYGPSTMFPATMALSASWDADLATQFGDAIGADARARGVHIILAPALNIYRSPLCGRNFEYMGEDPFLTGTIASHMVRAVQARGVAATVKHFAANNHETWRDDLSSDMDERTLREIYLPAFRMAIHDGGASCVMCAYNLLNGTHCSASAFLNNTILKGDWHFSGVLMSDWGASHDTLGTAIGGLDLEMPSGEFFAPAKLNPLIASGAIPQSVIDDKVRRVLRLTASYGWTDGTQEDKSIPLDRPESDAVALQIAREGTVLLKNTGNVLPLDRNSLKRLAVLGPNAFHPVTGGGSSQVRPFHAVSFIDGIKSVAGADHVVGIGWKSPDASKSQAFDHPIKLEVFSKSGEPTPTRTAQPTDVHFQWDPKAAPGGPDAALPADARPFLRWSGTFTPKSAETEVAVEAKQANVKIFIDGQLRWERDRDGGIPLIASVEPGKSHALVIEAEARKPGTKFSVSVGWGPPQPLLSPEDIETLRTADAAVVSVGFNAIQYEGEGTDRSYDLPGRQEELIREVAKINPKTIVLLNAGGSVATERWIDSVPAFVHAFYAGQEGGRAIGEILFGDVDPSGRLPFSYEKRWEDCAAYPNYPGKERPNNINYAEGIFLGYRWFDAKKIAPLFPFGHGLSYTTFDISNLKLEPRGNDVVATVDVKNTGTRPGDEVVQVYVGQPAPRVPRPVRELKGFARVSLSPGETKSVEVTLPRDAFAYFDPERKAWTVDDTDFTIDVGASSGDLRQHGTVHYK
jgi:beta-glucosidase